MCRPRLRCLDVFTVHGKKDRTSEIENLKNCYIVEVSIQAKAYQSKDIRFAKSDFQFSD